MQEFIKKLIERLEEESDSANDRITEQETEKDMAYYDGFEDGCDKAIEIVNQLAEEYNECIKSSCSNCETYDNEKHYCPKWCDVIKGTVAEIEENHNNDFCDWKEISVGGITVVKEPHRMKLFNRDHEQQFCQYCGKKIKVVE